MCFFDPLKNVFFAPLGRPRVLKSGRIEFLGSFLATPGIFRVPHWRPKSPKCRQNYSKTSSTRSFFGVLAPTGATDVSRSALGHHGNWFSTDFGIISMDSRPCWHQNSWIWDANSQIVEIASHKMPCQEPAKNLPRTGQELAKNQAPQHTDLKITIRRMPSTANKRTSRNGTTTKGGGGGVTPHGVFNKSTQIKSKLSIRQKHIDWIMSTK